MFEKEIFGKRLKEARKAKNMTQSELASSCGVSTQTIISYEKGNGALPNTEIAVDMANTLGVSLDWLFGSAKKTAEAPFETLSDVAKVLLKLSSDFCSMECFERDVNVPEYTDYNGQLIETGEHEEKHRFIGFDLDGSPLGAFFETRDEMLKLLYSKKITSDVYALWISNEMEKLSKFSSNFFPF